MEALTGQREMSAAALKAYFQPLEQWLDVFLAESGDCIGWGGMVQIVSSAKKKKNIYIYI